LDLEKASHYQNGISVLHWCIELGRVDIIMEVSTLASFLAMPHEGHLEAMYHVYAYMKRKHNARLVLDPTYNDADEGLFVKCDWKEFYGDVKEPIPPNVPEPLGKEVDVKLCVDSSHADDQRVRRSRTGYFVFLNSALINWLSKKQATVESSVFGAEFEALKHGIGATRGIQYKLQMMGMPISGPTYVCCNNKSVVTNTLKPESMLKKKSNSICFDFCRESVAMDESAITHIPSEENPADLATKIIGGGMKCDKLVGMLLHDIVD
jgi:hypothetical protein